MNEKENKIAAAMLDQLGDKLANNCCNDWDFPEDWTMAEKQTFIKEYHEWNGDPEEYDENKEPFISDFCVANFLSHKMTT